MGPDLQHTLPYARVYVTSESGESQDAGSFPNELLGFEFVAMPQRSQGGVSDLAERDVFR